MNIDIYSSDLLKDVLPPEVALAISNILNLNPKARFSVGGIHCQKGNTNNGIGTYDTTTRNNLSSKAIMDPNVDRTKVFAVIPILDGITSIPLGQTVEGDLTAFRNYMSRLTADYSPPNNPYAVVTGGIYIQIIYSVNEGVNYILPCVFVYMD